MIIKFLLIYIEKFTLSEGNVVFQHLYIELLLQRV
jgi:hypothetical protein